MTKAISVAEVDLFAIDNPHELAALYRAATEVFIQFAYPLPADVDVSTSPDPDLPYIEGFTKAVMNRTHEYIKELCPFGQGTVFDAARAWRAALVATLTEIPDISTPGQEEEA